jgi:hypothetical protein
MAGTDGEPTRHKVLLVILTLSLEQHETWRFHPAGVGMLAPMSVREEKVTI